MWDSTSFSSSCLGECRKAPYKLQPRKHKFNSSGHRLEGLGFDLKHNFPPLSVCYPLELRKDEDKDMQEVKQGKQLLIEGVHRAHPYPSNDSQ